MLVTSDWVIQKMNEWAPENTAAANDNVGLLVGGRDHKLSRVLVALDCYESVINEAIANGSNLIITHHPLIFSPLKNINADTELGWRVMMLIRYGISVYASHSNLDMAEGGVNDVLFEILQLEKKENLLPTDDKEAGLGRVGVLPKPMMLPELAAYAGARLGLNHIRYATTKTHEIKKVGLCAGSGSNLKYFNAAVRRGCDAYLTGDIKFHEAQLASIMGLSLVDVTHYASELPIVEKICRYLSEQAKLDDAEIEIIPSSVNGQIFQTIASGGDLHG